MTKTFQVIIFSCCALLAGCRHIPFSLPGNGVSRSIHSERVRADGRMVPMYDEPAGGILIDGQRNDWPDFGGRATVIHQWMDQVIGSATEGPGDWARFALVREERALCVTIEVRDVHVINPSAAEAPWDGDSVELFLDVRPIQGKSKLGDAAYSNGVHQFIIVPPTDDDGRPLRWQAMKTNSGARPLIEVAGLRTSNGYIIEARLPLASLLPNASPQRLDHPIGFNVQVNDRDPEGDGPHAGPRTAYSWSDSATCYEDAATFACADSRWRNPVPAGIVRDRFRHADGETQIQAWVMTAPGVARPDDPLVVTCHHEQNSFDGSPGSEASAPPEFNPSEKTFSDACPDMGAVYGRTMEINSLAPGRYEVAVSLAHWPGPARTANFYYRASRWPGLFKVPASKPDADIPAEMTQFPYLPELETYYPRDRECLKGRVEVDVSPWSWDALSRAAGAAEARGKSYVAPVGVRLSLREGGDEGRLIWSDKLSLRPGGMDFEIPLRGLARGAYSLAMEAFGPGGAGWQRGECGLADHCPDDAFCGVHGRVGHLDLLHRDQLFAAGVWSFGRHPWQARHLHGRPTRVRVGFAVLRAFSCLAGFA